MKKLIIDLSSKANSDSKYNDLIDYTGAVKNFGKVSTDYSFSKKSAEGSLEYLVFNSRSVSSKASGTGKGREDDMEDRIESLMGELDVFDSIPK